MGSATSFVHTSVTRTLTVSHASSQQCHQRVCSPSHDSMALFATQNEGDSTTSTSSSTTTTSDDNNSNMPEEDILSSLPPELNKIALAFRRVGDDDSLRHKQLLYMANSLPLIAKDKMIPENKVPGCLSTVFIDGTARWNDEKQDYVIDYCGECDGLLTKGLVALLVRGLSGSTASEIQAVNPKFIQEAQIGQSLTPGRNNGFLNMLNVMKQKAITITEEAKASTTTQQDTSTSIETMIPETTDLDLSTDRPMYHGIMTALQVLKPTVLDLVDNSNQHAGHEGSKGFHGESHFDLYIVADAFDGLNLVKRHKLIYMLLGQIMPKIHALKISAKTPAEVQNK